MLAIYRSDFPLKVQKIEAFDHRVLQYVHDTIAAWYRYQNGDWVTQLRLPFSEQASNPLVAREEEYETEWWWLWQDEIDEISHDGQIERAILEATGCQNSAKGCFD